MNTNDINEYLQSLAQQIHERHEHVQIRISLCQNKKYERTPEYSIYCGAGSDSGYLKSMEAAMEAIVCLSPANEAAIIREKAAKLIAEAEAIEAKAAAL